MTAEQLDPPVYPFGDTSRLEVDPRYDAARRQCPVSRVHMPHGGDAWLATSHAAVRTVLSDRRFSRAAAEGDVPRLLPAPPPGGSILTADPPAHGRLRRPVVRAFTARRIQQLRPRVEEIVAGLVDDVVAHGAPADLRLLFAEPLAITVICEVLGVPLEDRDVFRALTTATMAVGGDPDADVGTAMAGFFGYLDALVQSKRGGPPTDLLGELIVISDAEEQLTAVELVWLGVALLIGGHETTLNQLGDSLVSLLTRPDQLELLRARPELMANAVEELLRFVPLNAGSAYAVVATEDVEVDGVTVRAGEAVVPDIAVANRDPAVFDRPDELDITRADLPHLAFGFGAHHCIGAQLARLELKVALRALLERFPDLALAVPEDELEWNAGSLIRGPVRLPVTW